MRIRELADISGTTIPTIKFYLREGVLPTGRKSSRNAATYSAAHVERLRLVGVLRQQGGLSLPAIRELLRELAEAGARPEREARAAALDVLRALRSAALDLEHDGASPLDLGDRAWLLARGLERAADRPGAFQFAVAGFRDSALARTLGLDLEDLEPLVQASQAVAGFQVALIERALRLDLPLVKRLELVLEVSVLVGPLTDGSRSGLARGLLERLL